MTDVRRVYYYLVIGAFGGLTGWFVSAVMVRALGVPKHSLASLLLYGGILGAAIGLAVTAYDGLVNRSVSRVFKFGAVGLCLGAFAGALALPLGDWLWHYISPRGAREEMSWQSVLVATLCWIVVGGLIGLGEGISKGTQSWKGLAGGLVGGLVGGLLHELTAGGTDGDSFGDQFFLASSLLMLGAAIGMGIAYVTEVLKRAWFEIRDGKFAGRTYDVTKYVDRALGRHRAGVIGSDQWRAQIYLPGDRDICPLHATINFANGAPTLTVAPEAGGRAATFVNDRRLTASTPLSDGDRLQFGSTRVVYRHKRRRWRARASVSG
jgi:hypothetical protein